MKYLYITRLELNKNKMFIGEIYGLFYTYINTIEIHVMVNQKFTNQKWIACLAWSVGSSWIYYNAKNSWKTHVDIHLKVKKLLQFNDFSFTAPSKRKVDNKIITKEN